MAFWFGLSFYSIFIQLVRLYQDKKHKLLRSINAIHFLKNNNKIDPIKECISMEEKIERIIERIIECEESTVIPSLQDIIISEANGEIIDGLTWQSWI
jgi:hypothetical protein